MSISFKQRNGTLERLDTGDYTADEYERWLGEMSYIHSFFGELRALKKTLLREIRNSAKDNVAILDVGAGNGYLLSKIARWTKGRCSFFVGADIGFEAVVSIREFGAKAVQCDALKLPFADAQFDYALCTLMLHHLSDEDAVKLLTEMARVSRGKIFVVDLNRDRMAYYLYKLFAPIFFQRLTVEDGALSILRSRTPDELRHLAEAASLQQIEIVHSRLNRLVLSGLGACDE